MYDTHSCNYLKLHNWLKIGNIYLKIDIFISSYFFSYLEKIRGSSIFKKLTFECYHPYEVQSDKPLFTVDIWWNNGYFSQGFYIVR